MWQSCVEIICCIFLSHCCVWNVVLLNLCVGWGSYALHRCVNIYEPHMSSTIRHFVHGDVIEIHDGIFDFYTRLPHIIITREKPMLKGKHWVFTCQSEDLPPTPHLPLSRKVWSDSIFITKKYTPFWGCDQFALGGVVCIAQHWLQDHPPPVVMDIHLVTKATYVGCKQPSGCR